MKDPYKEPDLAPGAQRGPTPLVPRSPTYRQVVGGHGTIPSLSRLACPHANTTWNNARRPRGPQRPVTVPDDWHRGMPSNPRRRFRYESSDPGCSHRDPLAGEPNHPTLLAGFTRQALVVEVRYVDVAVVVGAVKPRRNDADLGGVQCVKGAGGLEEVRACRTGSSGLWWSSY